MTNRNIIAVLVLSIITCGIYSLYWFYVTTNELNEVDNDTSTDLMNYVLAIILGILTCGIYLIYWQYKFFQKVDKVANGDIFILSFILSLFVTPIVGILISQDLINKYNDTPKTNNTIKKDDETNIYTF